jgi:predicted acyl esterase
MAPGVTAEFIPDATLMIPMRDGTLLSTDIYLPTPDAKNLPCILLRSPAGRKAPHWRGFAAIAKAGYMVAIQDTRSALDLQGKTFPFISDAWGKDQDGYDAIEWLAKSPYTNGQVGTWGSSALGITQLLLAPCAPPHLKCQYIIFAASSMYHHAMFSGGQLLKNQTENWLRAYAPDSGIFSYLSQQLFYNDFWHQFNTLHKASSVRAPAIHIAGWFDTFLQGSLDGFNYRQKYGGPGAKGTQKLVIGPWAHYWPLVTKLGDFDVPKAGYAPPFDISPKAWFDHYLKGVENGIEALPPVIYYVMGPLDGSPSSGNIWRTADSWPVPAVMTPFYLTPNDGLQQEEVLVDALVSYQYNPLDAAPTIGGHNLFLEAGAKDQRPIEERGDVLLFTSPILQEDVEVTGHLLAKLFFSSDQIDTDIVVRLCDVYPDGRSILISEGSYRVGVMNEKPAPKHAEDPPQVLIKMIPNQPSEVHVDLWATSLVFAKGHAIRLSVTSSNYPRLEKNMNVGVTNTLSGHYNLAKNTIYMGQNYPSQLILPIVRKGEVWLKR